MTLPNSELRNLYQQTILQRSRHPLHRGTTDPVHRSHRGQNPHCGDTIELTVCLDVTHTRIQAVKFQGEGCAIALAAADLMAEAITGCTIVEGLELCDRMKAVLRGQSVLTEAFLSLNILQAVAHFPVRIACAALPWETLKISLKPDLTPNNPPSFSS